MGPFRAALLGFGDVLDDDPRGQRADNAAQVVDAARERQVAAAGARIGVQLPQRRDRLSGDSPARSTPGMTVACALLSGAPSAAIHLLDRREHVEHASARAEEPVVTASKHPRASALQPRSTTRRRSAAPRCRKRLSSSGVVMTIG
jgi:hypothetical protein